MPHILLVEDAMSCQVLVKNTLSEIAQVSVRSTLAEARHALEQDAFDLLLLNLSLPDGDGLEFFAKLQASDQGFDTPVVFVTEQAGCTSAQVAAFSLGADDFVVKPLHPVEFRARIEARLRRRQSPAAVSTVLTRGDLRIELDTQRAIITALGARRELELTGREFKILCHLAKNEGTVFSRNELIEAVWGASVHVLDRTVDTHVYTLRKKLGAYASYIESEVGAGYRLNSSRPKREKLVA